MSVADLLDDLLYASLDTLSLPDVYLRLRQVMDAENSSMADAAEVLSLDPALAARVLRMANSAFYGLRSQVDTITLAASILGMQKLHDLALAVSVSKAVDGMRNEVMDLNTFWRRSVRCGFLARQLAESVGLRNLESIFIRGLLHDLGHLVLFSAYPDESRQALSDPSQGLEGRMQEESASIGAHALQLTARLARVWQLPKAFVDTYEHLLRPDEVDPPLSREIAIINIAAHFTRDDYSEAQVAEILQLIPPVTWKIAGLDPEVGIAALDESMQEMSDAMYRVLTQ